MADDKARYSEIDLLRGMACIAVVAYHYLSRGQRVNWISSYPSAPVEAIAKFGFLGVELFFIISGFVIFMSAERSNVREFAASRVARLYPAFWIAVPLTALTAWVFASPFFQVKPSHVLANLTMVPHWFGVEFVDGAYWSLAVELHFYIAICIVIALGLMRRVEWLLAGWLLVSLVYIVRPIYALDLVLNARYGPYFCGGISAYLIRTRGITIRQLCLFASAYILAVCGLVVPEYQGLQNLPEGAPAWIASLVVTVFYALFLAIALGKWRMATSALTQWSGRLTFPVYLLHQNIGYVLLAALMPFLPSFGVRLLLIALTIGALAWFICSFIERPVSRRLNNLIAGRRRFGATSIN